MQPQQTRLPETLLNGGFNDTADNVARTAEAVGVRPELARQGGQGLTLIFLLMMVALLPIIFVWLGKKSRPQKKGKGRK